MNRWWILAVLVVARTAMAFQFQSVASLGPLLIASLALDYAALGTLIGLYMLPGIFIALPGGVLGQRLGAKRVVLAGLALMAIGGFIMAMSTSFVQLACGRLLTGVGAVLLNVLITKMVADWFAGREIVTAMSISIASWPLGIALGLMFFAPLSQAYGWSGAMQLAAAAAVLSLLLMALVYREPPGTVPAAASKLVLNLNAGEWRLVCLAGMIWGVYNVGYIVVVSFAPQFFVARGFAFAQASRLVSVVGWALIVTVPLSGYFAERLRIPRAVMTAGFAAVGLACAALPFTAHPVAMFLVVALAFGLPGGLIMALPAQALRAESRGAGMGVYFTWYYVAMAFLPAVAGMARDLSRSDAAPLLFAGAMMLAALACYGAFCSAVSRSSRSEK